ncbi:MAG: Zn-dependent exopeptidase M28, partial [Treponema sp.]|nr:Zn-dependent exopeptidase M28 [Treponema sp.]
MCGAGGFFDKAPYRRFMEFIAPGADRFGLLRSILDENGLAHEVLALGDKRHILLSGGPAGGRSIYTAHYDRTAGSPGANDNGAAVFLLMETALRPGTGPALFIFTDGEELSGDESLRDQGSYNLGLYLRQKGLGEAPVFTFDACGTGDTLIISTAADELLKNENAPGAEAARRRVQALRDNALEAARR